ELVAHSAETIRTPPRRRPVDLRGGRPVPRTGGAPMAHGPVPGPDAVLLVDGNEVSRAARARTLRDSGLAVQEAAGGRQALRQLPDGPDLLVLDVALPDLDGAEVCRRVKAGPASADIPVLMVSGAASGEDRVRGLEAGADAYLAGPAGPGELLAHAKALLRV